MPTRQRKLSYADLSLDKVRKAFALHITRQALFPSPEPVAPASWLREVLQRGAQIALTSEKARSEFIVAPILWFIRDLLEQRISIYSGVCFDVDSDADLRGMYDLTRARHSALMTK